jgi:hypothetical protein
MKGCGVNKPDGSVTVQVCSSEICRGSRSLESMRAFRGHVPPGVMSAALGGSLRKGARLQK